MDRDRNGMEVLDRDECLRRLGREGLGRVAVTIGALPAVFPVSYAVAEDGDIVFRTTPGSKLAAAARNAIVAFEVDRVDRLDHSGWSVLVIGPAREIVGPAELEKVARLPVTRWVEGDGPESVVGIESVVVSGRAIVHTPRLLGEDVAVPWSGRPLQACPACDSDALQMVSDGDWVNVLCTTCYSCWHVSLGWVRPVSPSRCPGCRLAKLCVAAHARLEAVGP